MVRTTVRATLAACTVLGAAVAGIVVAPAAVALSCVEHEEASPEAIASGTEVLATGEPFFATYDFAVIGTVTAIRTDERAGSPTYGATEIDVRVDGVLGTATAPEAMTLRAADPGWMAGYPFELGSAYFVPVLARSAEGLPNWTGPCDPVTPLDDPAATVTALAPLAGAAGHALAVPGEEPDRGSSDGAGSSSSGMSGWFVPATSATAVVAAGAAVVLLRRRPLRGGADVPLAVRDRDEGVERSSSRT